MSDARKVRRIDLPFKSVHIQCLDVDGLPIENAIGSGFIRREGESLFLYTCWHVVTGFDKNDIRIGGNIRTRAYLTVSLQAAEKRQPGIEAIGGIQTSTIPLYDMTCSPAKPLWYQDAQDIPQPDLNAINLRVPFWHDAIKIKLPPDYQISDMQINEEKNFFASIPMPGDKVIIVGFPYGFSVLGAGQPTPIILTRYIAASRIEGRHQEVVLDGAGAAGMSGGPVYWARDGELLLMGMYTGLIYPDHVREENERVTALETCSHMILCWAYSADTELKPYE